MEKSTWLFLVLLLVSHLSQGPAALAVTTPIPLDPKLGRVSFLAIGQPSAIRINGKGEGPEGQLSLQRETSKLSIHGNFKFNLDSLDTGISLRDRHMKEKYLETGRYHDAILALDPIDLPGNLDASSRKSVPFTGTLLMHGKQAKVSGLASAHLDQGDQATVSASFKIKLSDYGIAVPSFAGITVAQDVDVQVEFPLSRKAMEM